MSTSSLHSIMYLSTYFTVESIILCSCHTNFPLLSTIYFLHWSHVSHSLNTLWILLCGSDGKSHVSGRSKNPRTVCSHSVKVRDHWTKLHLGSWLKSWGSCILWRHLHVAEKKCRGWGGNFAEASGNRHRGKYLQYQITRKKSSRPENLWKCGLSLEREQPPPGCTS